MLNLFELNIKEKNKSKIVGKHNKYNKHFPSSTREWNNSIYLYNKNALNLIPESTILSMKLIKSYFDIYNYKLERKIRRKRLLRRLRKLSSNRIYVSNGGFKHTNNKIIITLYTFNRQKQNYILKIRKKYAKVFKFNIKKINSIFNLINYKTFLSIKNANKGKSLLIKTLTIDSSSNINYKSLSKYISKFYKKLVKKSLKKLKLYFYYKQLIYINESKFNYMYLQFIKKYLETFFKKNVEFNIVKLKRFYLNSDILSNSITLKIRKNRRKLLKYLNMIKKK